MSETGAPANRPGRGLRGMDEPKRNAPLDEGLVKAFAVGAAEPIGVRRIAEPVPPPRFADGGGVWRRILLTPWLPQPVGTDSLFRPLCWHWRLRIALRGVAQRARRLFGLPEPAARPSLAVLPDKRCGIARDWPAALAEVSLASGRRADDGAPPSPVRE